MAHILVYTEEPKLHVTILELWKQSCPHIMSLGFKFQIKRDSSSSGVIHAAPTTSHLPKIGGMLGFLSADALRQCIMRSSDVSDVTVSFSRGKEDNRAQLRLSGSKCTICCKVAEDFPFLEHICA